VTVSAGVGAAEGPFDPRALLASADAALYEAKRAGRDRTVVAAAPVAT
jgi:PleD family two-component response regulator